MSEAYRWRFEDTSGQPLPSEHSVPFPTQADAEAWFAESWEDLAGAGVVQRSGLGEEIVGSARRQHHLCTACLSQNLRCFSHSTSSDN